jgi:hypothetical protein
MGHKITNVPLILKIRDITFCFGLFSLWGISLDILRGLDFFDPLKISLEMAYKVICPQKK